MSAAGTGHRPERLYQGEDRKFIYSSGAVEMLARFIEINYMKDTRHSQIISGGAQGFDQALAIAAIRSGKELIMAIPFEGQENKWPVASQHLYRRIMERATKVEIISPGGYSPDKMMLRNQWMVDHAVEMVALWDGEESGGTYRCIKYAESKAVPVVNLWDLWAIFRKAHSEGLTFQH